MSACSSTSSAPPQGAATPADAGTAPGDAAVAPPASDAGTSDAASSGDASAAPLGCQGSPIAEGAPDFRSELRDVHEVFATPEGYAFFIGSVDASVGDLTASHWRLGETFAEIAPPREVLGLLAASGTSPTAIRIVADGADGFVGAASYNVDSGESIFVRDIALDGHASAGATALVPDSVNMRDDDIGLAVAPSGKRLVSISEFPLVGLFDKGATTLTLADPGRVACPGASLLDPLGGVLHAPAWTGGAFQGFCRDQLLSIAGDGSATSVPVTPSDALPSDTCVLTGRTERFGSEWWTWGWTYQKFSMDGLPPGCGGSLPDGAVLSLRASKFTGAGFTSWTTLFSFAEPASNVPKVDVLWDGTALAVLSDVSATEWQIHRIALDGSAVGTPASITVDKAAWGGRLHVVRGGYLLSWAQGGDLSSGGGGGAQRFRCR